jgi:hypothetical protein
MQRFLDGGEKVGNLVQHPVLIFVILILIVISLSHLLATLEVGVSFEAIVPLATDPPADMRHYDPRLYETGGIVQTRTMDEKSYTIEQQTLGKNTIKPACSANPTPIIATKIMPTGPKVTKLDTTDEKTKRTPSGDNKLRTEVLCCSNSYVSGLMR